ncbi:MAG: response regulator transcription factor [Lachnospiraceae bacterium]|nr:response regulator transcription factor [Lachnospiraceae bacterium]
MASNKYKILVVEDDEKISSFLNALLEANDYQVVLAETCGLAKMMFNSHQPDLVVLDLGLPDEDGTVFVRDIREHSAVPIIVLSARNSEEDKVEALDYGANDYVTKPFGSAEFLARVRSMLRNTRHLLSEDFMVRGKFVLDEMVIDFETRKLYLNDVEIKLTQTEFNIMTVLSEHCGKVLTYAAIVNAIWGYPDAGSIKKLQVNMANIRKKLGMKPGEDSYIVNELGVGYRLKERTEK